MELKKFFPKTNCSTFIGNGTQEACEREIDLLTKQYEAQKIWMIEEVREGFSVVRRFATQTDGHVFDLIVCSQIEIPVHYVEL